MRHMYYVTYSDGMQIGAMDVKAPPVSNFDVVKAITEVVRTTANPPLRQDIIITGWQRFERPVRARRWRSSDLA